MGHINAASAVSAIVEAGRPVTTRRGISSIRRVSRRRRKARDRDLRTPADADAFVGYGDWAPTGDVLMVAEVTSYDSDTDRRGRVEKSRAYAEAGIPVYLLIDRDSAEVVVHSEPDGIRYETVQTLPFGKTVRLPEPVGISLDTESLKNWVR
nr:Uma2 family endonuclease [Streptomyces sp. CBMA156]